MSTQQMESVIDKLLGPHLSERSREWLKRRYTAVTLAFITIFVVAIRLQPLNEYRTDGEIIFTGNDPWYHYRQVVYTVSNWPTTMDYDVWTGYPVGSQVTQFGTLFDQILATIALIIGLGSPSDETIRLVLVVAPVIFAALAAIVTYYLTRDLYNSRATGLVAATFIALIPGTFLRKTLSGVGDHNAAEPFFMATALFAFFIANKFSQQESIVVELFKDRDWEVLRPWALRASLSGFCLALYLLVWPPGIILAGIIGLGYLAYSLLGYVHSWTTEPPLLSASLAGFVTAGIMMLSLDSTGFETTEYSLLQVMFPLLLSVGLLALVALQRVARKNNVSWQLYTGGVVTSGVVSTVTFAVAAPGLFRFLLSNVSRVVGLGIHARLQTIGEAQPVLARGQASQYIISQYGFLSIMAVLGAFFAVSLVLRNRAGRERNANYVLVVTWAIVLFLAAMTQARFNYYFAVPVAVLAAGGVRKIAVITNLRESAPTFSTYQVITILLLVLLIVPVLVVPFQTTAVARADSGGNSGYLGWQSSLEWLSEETPEGGQLERADNESVGVYRNTGATDDYAYEDGTYGVLSWWDYGHWITATGERMPVANPFQQHAPAAAEFLLATSDEEATQAVEQLSDNEEVKTRYVMVDWKMVVPPSKFFAPTVWNENVSSEQFYSRVIDFSDRQVGFYRFNQRYYDSLVTRLYYYHGSRAEKAPITVTTGNQQGRESLPATQAQPIVFHNSSAEAEDYARNAESRTQIGGVGRFPTEPTPALENYRLVHASNTSAFNSGSYARYLRGYNRYSEQRLPARAFNPVPAWTKVFERVPGATVQGTGAPSEAEVRIQGCFSPSTYNSSFRYQQITTADGNGNFEFTVPYSTTGYSNWGPDEGYTNTSVRASDATPLLNCRGTFRSGGDERFLIESATEENQTETVFRDRIHVQESAVIGEQQEPVTAALEEVDIGTDSNSTDE